MEQLRNLAPIALIVRDRDSGEVKVGRDGEQGFAKRSEHKLAGAEDAPHACYEKAFTLKVEPLYDEAIGREIDKIALVVDASL